MHLHNIAMRTRIERNDVFGGQLLIHKNRNPDEIPQWGHGSEFAIRKESSKIRFCSKTHVTEAQNGANLIEVEEHIGGDHRQGATSFTPEDNNFGDIPKGQVFHGGKLPCRENWLVDSVQVFDPVGVKKLEYSLKHWHNRPPSVIILRLSKGSTRVVRARYINLPHIGCQRDHLSYGAQAATKFL
jgi:hypothetical protein